MNRDELLKLFHQANANKNYALGNRILKEIEQMDAVGARPTGTPKQVLAEPVLSMLTGMGSDVTGQVAGGAASIESLGGSMERGRQVREQVRQGLPPYQPRSKMGQIGQQALARGMETIGDYAEEIPAFIAGTGERLWGDPSRVEQTKQEVRDTGFFPTVGGRLIDENIITPEQYAMMGLAGEAAPYVAGGGLALARQAKMQRIGDEIRGAQERAKNKELVTYEQAQDPAIWDTPGLQETGRYQVNPRGAVIKDANAKALESKGFDSGRLTDYKASTDSTKDGFMEMINIKKTNMVKPGTADYLRASRVPGKRFEERLNFLKNIKSTAGASIDTLAERTLRGQQVDLASVEKPFLDAMDSMGVKLRSAINKPDFFYQGMPEGERIKKIKSLFKGSDLARMSSFQRPLINVIDKSLQGGTPDAYDLHKLKRYIDENVSWGKQKTGLSASVEHSLKELRNNINEIFKTDNRFSDYAKANLDYSETTNAIDMFNQAVGRKVAGLDTKQGKEFEVALDDIKAEAVGQEMRKFESNYQARMPIFQALQEIERLSKKHGGGFDDDLVNLTRFATDLDEVFGPTGRNTFESRITRAVSRGTGRKGSMEFLTDMVKDKMAPDDEKAMNALKDMIQRGQWRE